MLKNHILRVEEGFNTDHKSRQFITSEPENILKAMGVLVDQKTWGDIVHVQLETKFKTT